jgi:hypothetical protein
VKESQVPENVMKLRDRDHLTDIENEGIRIVLKRNGIKRIDEVVQETDDHTAYPSTYDLIMSFLLINTFL